MTEEETEYQEVSRVCNILLACIDLLILICTVYITYHVMKLTKCSNWRIATMLSCMNLTLLTDMLREIYLAYDATKKLERNFYERDEIAFQILYFLPVIMLHFAIVVNINTWGFYWIVIRKKAS